MRAADAGLFLSWERYLVADIVIEGLDKLEAKLGRLASLSVLAPPMVRSLARLHSFMATDAPKRPQKQPFKSEKQRRWFFWALDEGMITVPYHRTGLLGRAWQMRVENTGAQMIGVLSNPTPYGPFVQAPPPRQAAYHVGNWRTTDDAVEKIGPFVIREFDRAIREALR